MRMLLPQEERTHRVQKTLRAAAPPGLGWDPDQDVALQRVRLWAVSAREYQTQASHILFTPPAEGLPPA
eukprot:2100756-Alexandrium_andersonii.AAC.1